ncbi:MAG: carbamoyltransferase HypF [Nanohaloarchaea archaeon]|nr:carbamoyltransferase HypF [Candidatus Nanohaloarchaea archaeon]
MFYKIIVIGAVQGVGFRPFVYREAKRLALKGYVRNTSRGVEIVVDDGAFVDILKDKSRLPPMAVIDHIDIEKTDILDSFFSDFEILGSKLGGGITEVLPDTAICADCLRELNDNLNRRHRYHFTTCTNCGPRFSITKDMPYDRNMTSMSEYNMCDKCKKEYLNPFDKRYHAQTIACHDCGPKLSFFKDGKMIATSSEAVDCAVSEIKNGNIVAIKGVGGYHLCCDATNPYALKMLRKVIKRPSKPLAIMVGNISLVTDIALISSSEKSELTSKERPIVVLQKKDKGSFLKVSALDSIGIMLPYTALHYLILDKIKVPLVMTSCNVPGEPMDTESQSMVNLELSDDRQIVNRVDDSVIKFIDDKRLFLRRSRGFAPRSIDVGVKNDVEIIALGADESNTFSIYKDGKVFVSQHMGNLSNVKAVNAWEKNIDFFLKITKSRPSIVVCDMHPDHYSTKYAYEFASKIGARVVPVQHHVAHAYSVGLEHGLSSFVGISCDGSGYGLDGGVWGGEVFVVKDGDYRRVGHLSEQILVGGESAVLEPKKMLFGILSRFLNDAELSDVFGSSAVMWKKQIDQDFNILKTTSCGRIFDAASYLLGICNKRTYSGEPAITLESSVSGATPYGLEPVIETSDGVLILNTTVLFEFLWENKDKDKSRLAATVFDYVSRGLYMIAESVSEDLPIVFSGGVAYNRYVTGYMIENGVLINLKVPAGDGGISFGQIGFVLSNN